MTTFEATCQTDLRDNPPHEQYWAGCPEIGSPQTIPALLKQAAAKWPESVALNFFDEGIQITFGDLRDQALRVANGLLQRGFRAGDRVGILLANVLEFPVTWLGIIEMGAVAVPMNPALTRRELEFLFEDVGLSGLICGKISAETVRAICQQHGVAKQRCVVVGEAGPDGFGALLDQPATMADLVGRHTGDLVSIQFTSGTTGLPKGCMLTHAYWSNLALTCFSLMEGVAHRNILGDHPFFYMQNQSYLITTLSFGATLHVSRQLSLRRYVGWLHEFGIDFAWIGDALLSLPETDRDRGHKLLRAPTDGIDPKSHGLIETRFGLATREWYASTEFGMAVATAWSDHGSIGDGSIGYPVLGRETKLIDAALKDITAPGTGELCIRGPGMMLGYWNRAEVNAELFMEGGWFRTGDLVRIDAEGRHFFIGRIKDTIRRSGENIAAAEVEQEIGRLPGVEISAVIPVPDAYRGEEVKAIIVRKDPSLTVQAVRDWCEASLAPFKVPRYIEFRESLPFTASGKIQKSALKSEAGDPRTGAYDFVDGVQR